MWPVLLQLGSWQWRTISIFLVLAWLSAAFVFWRRTREEHYQEGEAFDGFLAASLVGLVWARVSFVIWNFASFGLHPLAWLAVGSRPGLLISGGLVGAGWWLARHARKQKWDVYELLDFGVTAASVGLGWLWLGRWFDGSFYGSATALPWGMVFPGVLAKHHPVQLYWVVVFILLSWYLSWLEYHYRTFQWYRAGRNSAQTGFLTCVFIMTTCFAAWLIGWVMPSSLVWQGIKLDQVVAMLGFLWGALLLYFRSGRTVRLWRWRRLKGVQEWQV